MTEAACPGRWSPWGGAGVVDRTGGRHAGSECIPAWPGRYIQLTTLPRWGRVDESLRPVREPAMQRTAAGAMCLRPGVGAGSGLSSGRSAVCPRGARALGPRGARALGGCTAGSTVSRMGGPAGFTGTAGCGGAGDCGRLAAAVGDRSAGPSRPPTALTEAGRPRRVSTAPRLLEQLTDTHPERSRTARDTTARVTMVTATATVTARSTPSAGVSRAPARRHSRAALLQVDPRQKPSPEPRRKSVLSEVDIRHSQGYRFSCTQEVEVGTADRDCRACRSSRTRPEGAASSTRVIQQYNRVAEGKEQNAIRIARARSESARVPQGPGLEGGPRSRIRDPRSPALPGGTCGTRRPTRSAGRWC